MELAKTIGRQPWTKAEILEDIDEFTPIYGDRPIRDNYGGMKAPHMFAVWFTARKLEPDLIVESGIWKGQSTWLLEEACPQAKLISIDLNLDTRQYVSDKAVYYDRDFSEQDWSEVTDRSLVFLMIIKMHIDVCNNASGSDSSMLFSKTTILPPKAISTA